MIQHDADENFKRTVHYSCRLGAELYQTLHTDARQRGVSMNNMLNPVGGEYVYKKNFEKIGSLTTCRDVLRGLFDIANDKQLIKLAARLGSGNAVEYVGMLYHDVNKGTVLEFLDLWGRRFSGYEHRIHGKVHSFSIPHDINEKYSVFMKEFITSFLESTTNEPTKVQSTSRTVTFSIAD